MLYATSGMYPKVAMASVNFCLASSNLSSLNAMQAYATTTSGSKKNNLSFKCKKWEMSYFVEEHVSNVK